ncbi:MAG: hypothetical protein Kow0022_06240 [Phycisphaerales bacterium]
MAKVRDFTVVLMRSCATEWDECGRLVGSSDLPVCDAGRVRVEQALDAAGPFNLDVVFCGPDEGSVQIGQMLAAATNARLRTLESLGEIHLGLWEGLRESQLADRFPTAFRQWQQDPSSVLVPGGESFVSARDRIVDGLMKAMERAKSKDTRIGVVVRPMAWGMLRCWLGAMPCGRFWEVLQDAPLLVRHEVDLGQLMSAAEPSNVEP